MDTIAAVITGKKSAAIAAIAIEGAGALNVCRQLTADKSFALGDNTYKLCNVKIDGKVVDEVLIAREGSDKYVINCHGNPLIAKQITTAATSFGAKLLSLGQYTRKAALDSNAGNSIAAEINMLYAENPSLPAIRLIYEQGKGGLSAFIDYWLGAEDIDVEKLRKQCNSILNDSRIAKRIISKQKIVLAGLPNSGKSTLFNAFCGKQTAIVADFHGTTRDWLSADCSIGAINAQMFDTAGLDEQICNNIIDRKSQQRSQELLQQADMVVLVIDITDAYNPKHKQIEALITGLTQSPLLKVYNKADKIRLADCDGLLISAVSDNAANIVGDAIIEKFGIGSISNKTTICFTCRQVQLLEQISSCNSAGKIRQKFEQLKTAPPVSDI